MTKHFYNGAGNSFVILQGCECRHGSAEMVALVKDLCKEHSRDGVIVYDGVVDGLHQMTFYNPDGTSGMMCGNGGRCFVAFLSQGGFIGASRECWFRAADGEHFGRIERRLSENEAIVTISMQDASYGEMIDAWEDMYGIFLNTGAPHFVVPVPSWEVADLKSLDVERLGEEFRWDEIFAPEGTNVDFIAYDQAADCVYVRTYEKGVEGETPSCGTGVVAAALAFCRFDRCDGQMQVAVHTQQDEFLVEFVADEYGFTDIYLTGPVEKE